MPMLTCVFNTSHQAGACACSYNTARCTAYSYVPFFLYTSAYCVLYTWSTFPMPIPSSHCSSPLKPGLPFQLPAIRVSEHIPFRKHMHLRLLPHPHVHVYPSLPDPPQRMYPPPSLSGAQHPSTSSCPPPFPRSPRYCIRCVCSHQGKPPSHPIRNPKPHITPSIFPFFFHATPQLDASIPATANRTAPTARGSETLFVASAAVRLLYLA